ncbi:MAG: hypothetical protein GX592_14980, partial [Clostridiales bacterium]|nr:hypothetical protein [Clostridiales bacterium]
MVYRLFVEKKPGFDNEARALMEDIRSFLGITSLTGLRLFNRYDAEGIEPELFGRAKATVFSEPQLDEVYEELPAGGDFAFATEYLPGQFDQRADSAAQCIQLLGQCERPAVRTALVYVLEGALSEDELRAIRKYVINPVERREASLSRFETLKADYALPETVPAIDGFLNFSANELSEFRREYGLAMDDADLAFCQDYFRSERRDPMLTEIRMIDTYWSDHCRHTTFLTELSDVQFDDPAVGNAYRRYLEIRAELKREDRPVTLMDLATIGAKYLKATGALTDLDESDEINACTVKIDVETDEGVEPWLLLFKNETHNHPTEIEPFGGAATCLGGAIRDPLSGRGYVYQAMRVTGAADPTRPIGETIPGKLPQRKLTTTAAAGYSSYGNQIGLATGLVDEIYHPGYAAKRMEIGAVVGAAPAKNVRRDVPAPGDKIVLLGGRTGRDGCGGATGSSKSHTISSLESCGAEVQKGNAPEERKLQRLFRNPGIVKKIKRCNDFGAGGVSVAIGELADGLSIDLDAVRHSLPCTGRSDAMTCAGVRCRFPPSGMSRFSAPFVASNRSISPRFEQMLRSSAISRSPSANGGFSSASTPCRSTNAAARFGAPFEFRNSRDRSTIVSPRQRIFNRFSSVTSATTVASRFSSRASARNWSTSSGASTTAMRSCDSEIASSVPSSPSYF